MGVFSSENEISSAIPPARLFKAFVLDGDNLMMKIAPQHFKSIELVEGEGGPGTIKKITFAEGKYMKHKIEAMDNENLTYCYSIIEGDALLNKLEKITFETKLSSSPDGGSICKSSSKYYTIGDFEMKEEQINAAKEKGMGMFKAIEAYLLANPDAYN